MSARRLEKRPNKGSGDNDGHVDVPKKKRETISTACTACQKRKSKCDGGKPTCSLCSQKTTHCEYPDDSRRTVNLRAQNQRLSSQISSYESLVDFLRQSSTGNARLIDQALSRLGEVGSSSPRSAQSSLRRGSEAADSPTEAMTPGEAFLPLLANWQISATATGQNFTEFGVQTPYATSEGASSLALSQRSHRISDNNVYGDSLGFARGAQPGVSPFHSTVQAFDATPAITGASETSIAAPSIDSVAEMPHSMSIGTVRIWNQTREREVSVQAHFVMPMSFGDDPVAGSFSDQYAKVYASFLAQKRGEIRAARGGAIGNLETDLVDGGAMLSDHHLEITDTLSAFVCRLIKTFLGDRITVLAFMHMRYRMMQWLVHPCEKTFDNLPQIMRPVPEQVCVPHPCWVDFNPMPGMRRLFTTKPISRSQDWLSTLSTCRINWNLPLEATMILEPQTGRYVPTPEFLQHIDNEAVWTLAASAAALLPDLQGHVNIRTT